MFKQRKLRLFPYFLRSNGDPEFQSASYEGWSPRAMAAWMMRLQYLVEYCDCRIVI